MFSKTQSKRLQKLQTRTAKIIMNRSNDVHHSVVLQALGWKTLDAERKKTKAKMMHKISFNKGSQSLTNLLTYTDEVTSYNLRNISSSLCLLHSLNQVLYILKLQIDHHLMHYLTNRFCFSVRLYCISI